MRARKNPGAGVGTARTGLRAGSASGRNRAQPALPRCGAQRTLALVEPGPLTTAHGLAIEEMARRLGGDVHGELAVRCAGPGRPRGDRSLLVIRSRTAPAGFFVYSHVGDPIPACRELARRLLGIVEPAP